MLKDRRYPHIHTPAFLLNSEPAIAKCFRKDLMKNVPEEFRWTWIEGETFPVGSVQKDEVYDPLWWWINKRYTTGCGRLKESCEFSTCVNFADLGPYRLNLTGYNPEYNKKDNKFVILIEFIYLRSGRLSTNDGTKRLRRFLDYIQLMPDNPYLKVILHPVGAEKMSVHSPHLDAMKYQKTGHDTEDLLKLYRYWLKAVPTPQLPFKICEWEHDRYFSG